ncbi:hypothetical protein [Spirosoma pollinicola]|uniref:Uncharacterized protein n=1 Tax=Spirosoma pollinicola TaxID=2057025 RepID=A0A2K8Z4X4_9BACT|nr:hypothetical protein [Spirosoma pollinicola]AUD04911.1 hypothetical protein CWM47_25540 [Spirosoma pollinicola]
MSQFPDQTDLQTDSHSPSVTPSSSTPPAAKTGPNPTQKKILGISAAAMLLGGTAWVVANPRPHGPDGSIHKDPMSPHADIDAAGKVDDTMSFERAFEVARDEVGMGGIFSWHGNWYNTFIKEEWGSLSLDQRQQFTELITQEHLPVKPYEETEIETVKAAGESVEAPEPTIIEGHINGQRVMGLDFNRDGVIDTLVMEGTDGSTYKIVDAQGDDGMDTLLRYDSFTGELIEIEKIDEPFVLSNDQFSQGLEASMSKEVVDSILEPEVAAPVAPALSVEEADDDDEPSLGEEHLADSHEPDDDSYINNGDVHDMDEQ